ncbi:hypothetical protein B0H19DRAFT_1264225 [Mycena capillaripes]|nr:hypothetical protein B0H19DRAFT_1264225 [Mycena capillaripes]
MALKPLCPAPKGPEERSYYSGVKCFNSHFHVWFLVEQELREEIFNDGDLDLTKYNRRVNNAIYNNKQLEAQLDARCGFSEERREPGVPAVEAVKPRAAEWHALPESEKEVYKRRYKEQLDQWRVEMTQKGHTATTQSKLRPSKPNRYIPNRNPRRAGWYNISTPSSK